MARVKGINFKALAALAQDLNKVLDLEPPIITKIGTKKDYLDKEIRKVCKLLEKTDAGKFTKASEALFIEMDIKVPWTGTDASAGGKKDEKAKSKAPATAKAKRITRIDASIQAIKKLKKGSIEAQTERANLIYIEAGGKDNSVEAKWAVGVVRQVMEAFGVEAS